MQLAISRRQEFIADAKAIEFTRNPSGLANALAKLDSDDDDLEVANSSTAHMYIVCPIKSKERLKNLFSTHPPIKDRIEAIMNIK
jgi:heat shock protein HtpX